MLLSLKTCSRLIWRDMVVFYPTFFDRFINGSIWIVLTVVVFQFIFPNMGMAGNYGPFMACANFVSWGFFEVMENVSRLIGDLQGEKTISYDLTLPLPQWMVFVRIALANTLQAMAIGCLILPMSKVVMWNDFSFVHFSVIKTLLVFVASYLFYGFFSLWIASMVPNLNGMTNIWMRIVYPMWWLGGYQFTWFTLYKVSPYTAQIMLLNPIFYGMEGMRAAVLGQEGYLNVWLCIAMLLFFTLIVGYIGTKKMMKRLDCL